MSGISDIGVSFLISGTIYHLLRSRPPPAAAQALRPLSRRSNRSSLLVLGPLGVSVDHWDTPDTLASTFTPTTARNVQFCRPKNEKRLTLAVPLQVRIHHEITTIHSLTVCML